METVSEMHGRKQELEARLQDLEQKRASLEREISQLVEQIPIVEMSRYEALLQSGNSSLKVVRDMLRTLVHERPATENEQAGSSAQPN